MSNAKQDQPTSHSSGDSMWQLQLPIVTWAAYEFAPPEETEVVGKFLGEDPENV